MTSGTIAGGATISISVGPPGAAARSGAWDNAIVAKARRTRSRNLSMGDFLEFTNFPVAATVHLFRESTKWSDFGQAESIRSD
jgi:hypothetical protein